MAIAPLPQATVHLLGSAQALTTPTSLIKELIDNALDAKALSIDIIISPNTIDKIEVRDNGHGIQQEDLDLLGKRGHTSKLRSFDELKYIGGVSLGFRGEALASAVELGEVTVVTRTEGESVATAVKLKSPGGIHNRSRTSHPIGTTVSVAKFMYNLPVRKQTFLKETSKTLGKIKDLLQAYILARPNIKFSFKVLKENKASWSYAPRPKDGIKEAVSQIFGKDAASQCISKSIKFPERVHDSDASTGRECSSQVAEDSLEMNNNNFIVDAFLPRPGANYSKIGHGQYISVDARPVSHEKNTMKRIVTIFKYYVKESHSEVSEKARSPFLRLNITCPQGSYDPNVEPAKNDVIFGNESVVLEAVEDLFREVYGAPKAASSSPAPPSLKEKLDNFELLLAQKPAAVPVNGPPSQHGRDSIPVQLSEAVTSKVSSQSPAVENIADSAECYDVDNEEVDEPVDRSRRRWAIDMSNDLTEEVEGYERPSRRCHQVQNTQNPVSDVEHVPRNPLNPWLIAKMTASVQQRNPPASTTSRVSYPVSRSTADPLLTPHCSSDPFASDPDLQLHIGSNRPRQTIRDDDVQSLEFQAVQQLPYQPPEGGSISLGDLRSSRRSSTADADNEVLLDGDESEIHRPRNDFVSARNIPETALLSPPASLGPKKPRGVNRPFVPPVKRNRENNALHDVDSLRQTKLTTDYGARGHNRIQQDLLEQQPNPDLEWSMDFEHRKELASRRRRDELRAATLQAETSNTREVLRNSPHKNRYNAAIATLEATYPPLSTNQTLREPFKTSLPDGDPRAYLMKRQKSVMAQRAKSGETPKMTRAKSSRLPLETISENEKTHNLVQRLSVDMQTFRKNTKELMKSDMYVMRGNAVRGLRVGGLETTGVAGRIQAIVEKWIESEGNQKCEVEYLFDNLVSID
ncbi:hypothetical protein L207DRAFT_512722 [Hyaloscypha variabilis F]|uniref:DNA mismatch repair protein S5 domain-containing protein n=1 Tax=Hyaloscypha variabilis (strain UAMH 11265 / GT02V1 / F) TaxID=1149755 RepID=A0A2J6RMM1_HYAVF|nr:hypothetical protein L207DRAFT_512722 [Hyaloscypha variabilis F]